MATEDQDRVIEALSEYLGGEGLSLKIEPSRDYTGEHDDDSVIVSWEPDAGVLVLVDGVIEVGGGSIRSYLPLTRWIIARNKEIR